jgi:hypothetical protein
LGSQWGRWAWAHAGPPAGSITGKVIIHGNRAEEAKTTAGASGGGSFLGIGGGGQKGDPKNTETLVQGVSVVGAQAAADITISGNHARKLVNDGARLTVQGVLVR